MDNIDIFVRSCKKEGLLPDLEEHEIEILDSETEPAIAEEEQLPEEEEKFDIKLLQRELECMKRRIQMLQLKLKMMAMAECPEEECVDFEVELTCSSNKEICALQKGHYKLQCQISELLRCCHVAKEQIQDLRERMCEKTRDILQLQKVVGVLNTWRNTLEHEFGVCLERFEYLKHVKAEWKDVEELLDKQRKCFSLLQSKFVPLACFTQHKKVFMAAIGNVKDLFNHLLDIHNIRFCEMDHRLRDAGIPPLDYNKKIKRSKYNSSVYTKKVGMHHMRGVKSDKYDPNINTTPKICRC